MLIKREGRKRVHKGINSAKLGPPLQERIEKALKQLTEVSEWVLQLNRRIEKLEKDEQQVFAQERKKNLEDAYFAPVPPWVRGLRRIRKGEEAFRMERMRKEADEARERSAASALAAHKARANEPSRPDCECCKGSSARPTTSGGTASFNR